MLKCPPDCAFAHFVFVALLRSNNSALNQTKTCYCYPLKRQHLNIKTDSNSSKQHIKESVTMTIMKCCFDHKWLHDILKS